MQKTTDEPLLEMNPVVSYPVIGQAVVNGMVEETIPSNNLKTQNDAIQAATEHVKKVNQGYPPNQGYAPNQGYPPNRGYVVGQPAGMQPAPPLQYYQPTPVPRQQVVVTLPTFIRPGHPQYAMIVEQYNQPCSRCSFIGPNLVSTNPGCAAVSWSVCLFCLTGFLCFWIPLVVDSCKDITISCSRCGNRKLTIQKPCC